MDDQIYVLHCNKCNFKRFSNGNDINDLLLVKQSSIPRNIPRLDPVKKKAFTAPEKSRTKMFKCPKCGYTVKAYKIQNIDETEESKTDE